LYFSTLLYIIGNLTDSTYLVSIERKLNRFYRLIIYGEIWYVSTFLYIIGNLTDSIYLVSIE